MLNSRNLLLMVITQTTLVKCGLVKLLFNTPVEVPLDLFTKPMSTTTYDKLGPSQVPFARRWHQALQFYRMQQLFLLTIGVFEAQPHFRTVFLQIQKLLAVKSSSPLLSNELHCIFILHSTLN
jgi:hypothetical protein